jgi:hypothetical protein
MAHGIVRAASVARGSKNGRSLVIVGARSGDQILTGGQTNYYTAAPEEPLEEIFDEYAANDVLIDPGANPAEAASRP